MGSSAFLVKGRFSAEIVSRNHSSPGETCDVLLDIEKQDSRLVWVGRNLKAHLVPPPCYGQGHLPLDQVDPNFVQPWSRGRCPCPWQGWEWDELFRSLPGQSVLSLWHRGTSHLSLYFWQYGKQRVIGNPCPYPILHQDAPSPCQLCCCLSLAVVSK